MYWAAVESGEVLGSFFMASSWSKTDYIEF